jgi:hypothetical protein
MFSWDTESSWAPCAQTLFNARPIRVGAAARRELRKPQMAESVVSEICAWGLSFAWGLGEAVTRFIRLQIDIRGSAQMLTDNTSDELQIHNLTG